jgi:hypothetical protein
MRARSPLLIFLCLSLFLTTARVRLQYLLLDAGDSGTAHCGGGKKITCSAYRCDCSDNVGCTGYDGSGNVVQDDPCPSLLY